MGEKQLSLQREIALTLRKQLLNRDLHLFLKLNLSLPPYVITADIGLKTLIRFLPI